MKNFKSIIFDIDGTLTDTISWVHFTEGMGGSIKHNDEIFDMWRAKSIPETDIRRKLVENWNKGGKTRQDAIKILDAIEIRKDAREAINYLTEKGYKLVLLTGSFDIYAEIISEKLGVPLWFSITKLVWGDKDKLIDVETVLNDKEQKKAIFKKFCIDNGYSHNECVPVGDSYNDMGLFELTGNGIAVRTKFEDDELEKVAWKKIINLSELKDIL